MVSGHEIIHIGLAGPILERQSIRGSDASLKSVLFVKNIFLNLNQVCKKQLPISEE